MPHTSLPSMTGSLPLVMIFTSLLVHLFLMLIRVESQTQTMCHTQIAVASQVCSLLPLRMSPKEQREMGVYINGHKHVRGDSDDEDPYYYKYKHKHRHGHSRKHKHQDDDDHEHDDNHDNDNDHDHDEDHGHAHDHDHEHEHEHDDEHDREDDEHEHHHRRRHRHHRSHIKVECCRWLEEIDSACVCEVLIRLPKFLTRPQHNITLAVEDTCRVNFACDGF